MSVFKLENVSYSYDGKKNVLSNFSHEFEYGHIYTVVGRSGSGKTTLLSLLAGLTSPTSGKIYLNDSPISSSTHDLRAKHIGVVFQSYNLLPHLNAIENVCLSMDIAGISGNRKAAAKQYLESVGIDEEDMKRKILKLSGGQQQRVAIARVLAGGQQIILADEPTGNLDEENQNAIIDIFRNIAHNDQKCVIIVTHSPEVEKRADTVIRLENKR